MRIRPLGPVGADFTDFVVAAMSPSKSNPRPSVAPQSIRACVESKAPSAPGYYHSADRLRSDGWPPIFNHSVLRCAWQFMLA